MGGEGWEERETHTYTAQTEFTVSVNYNEHRSYQSSIPKSIIEALGDPNNITFIMKNDSIRLVNNKSKK